MQVFKFTRVAVSPQEHDYTLENIEKKQIYLNSFDRLNDPHELMVHTHFKKPDSHESFIHYRRALSTYIKSLKEEQGPYFLDHRGRKSKTFLGYRLRDISLFNEKQMIKFLDKMGEAFQENSNKLFNSEVRVTCFSRVCYEPLLWAHYADMMRGICLEFDIPHSDSDERFTTIEYTDEPPLIDFWDYIDGSRRDLFIDMHKYKSKHWSYEQEERISAPCHFLNYPDHHLKCIIVGHKIPIQKISPLVNSLRTYQKKPFIRIATPSRFGYGIEISGPVDYKDLEHQIEKSGEYKPRGRFLPSTEFMAI